MTLFIGVMMPDSTQLFLLVLFAAFSTVLPYGLLNYVKVDEVSPTTEGLLLLGDPLLHTIWATLFIRQFVSQIQYLGAALILISAALNLKVKSGKDGG
jgi:drug/metabolite transporter (DMT)-like permease